MKYTLRETCLNTEFFLVRIFLYSVWIQEKTDQKKLRIGTLFTQWPGFTFPINSLSHINYKFRIYWYYSNSTIQKERIWATISDKNNWDSLYFHKKVPKKTLDLLKVTQNPSSPWLNAPPSLKKPCEAAKTRNELPICNQHWIRGKGRRVLQFLSLPVSKIKIFLKRVF